MYKFFIVLFTIPSLIHAQKLSKEQINIWETQAKQITIIRDHFGVPHIYGKTDADAVFGLMYAQCEDDFKRVEYNYIEKLGRLSEINGEKNLYNDLLNRLVIDSLDAIKDYQNSEPWLKKILDAYANGINFFIYKNPHIKPALIHQFQPWFPLLWTDGSIGAISTAGISVKEIKNFYSGDYDELVYHKNEEEKVTGSNGFAFAPSITESGNAILYINPHVSFYFRPEVHVISNEGLNAYGAVTWGQPFIYQGFNEKCGWMHTSSQADISDAYIEKIVKKNNELFYEYEGALRPIVSKEIKIRFKTDNGLEEKIFNTLFTHHGPILTKRNGDYLSLKHNNRDTKGFIQSWLRTKANSFKEFKQTMDMGANPSNNTVYADAEGNIAYWHGNFLPQRDTNYNWAKPVDGTIKNTEWQGYHSVEESVHIYNPKNGWLQNCNSTPFTVAGEFSPKKENYASYLAPDDENYRGINAVRVLSETKDKFNLDKVITAGYNCKLSFFEDIIPSLIKAHDSSINNIYRYDLKLMQLNEPISILRSWDYYTSENSIATTLAIEWAQKIQPLIQNSKGNGFIEKTKTFAIQTAPYKLVEPLFETIKDLEKRFGTWQVPWGEINRFQRISNDIENQFDDSKPSHPVAFASSTWGMLPSYNSRTFDGSKKRYGVNGNSFVCAVEFGKKIKAKSLLAGGQSGNPSSKHFFDQGLMYSKGQFKEVLFYKDEVMKNIEKQYHPGE
ncbi:MAG: penicillin acylase family protein [Chitinophagaceae bacterium]|nr:penicillin acylase family protein [Chitinophagaceae bacterium]